MSVEVLTKAPSSFAERPSMSEQKHTPFNISTEGHKVLRLEAIKRGLSMSRLIARALAYAGVDIPAEDLKK